MGGSCLVSSSVKAKSSQQHAPDMKDVVRQMQLLWCVDSHSAGCSSKSMVDAMRRASCGSRRRTEVEDEEHEESEEARLHLMGALDIYSCTYLGSLK